jgi:hypothetical protein
MYIEKIPKSLLDDITSNRCIPFIGAGFSKNAKSAHNIHIPDWNGLGRKAAEYFSTDEYENPIESLSQLQVGQIKKKVYLLLIQMAILNCMY